MSVSLLRAVETNDLARVQDAMHAGADYDARNADDATTPMLAAHAGRVDIVRAPIAA